MRKRDRSDDQADTRQVTKTEFQAFARNLIQNSRQIERRKKHAKERRAAKHNG